MTQSLTIEQFSLKKELSLAFLLSLLTSLTLSSQELPADKWRIEANGLFGISFHDPTLDIYQGVPGCGTFSNLETERVGFGISAYRRALLGNDFGLFTSVSFRDRSISFSDQQSSPTRTIEGVEGTVLTRHVFELPMRSFGLTLGMTWEPINSIRIGLAPTVSYLSDGSIRQKEEIVSPLGATFTETNDYERPVDRGGAISITSIAVEGEASLSLMVPLSKSFYISPGIVLSHQFTSLENAYSWHETTVALSFGIGLRNGIVQTLPPIFPNISEPDVPSLNSTIAEGKRLRFREISNVDLIDRMEPLAPSLLLPNVVAVGIDDEGREYPDPVIEISEAPWSSSIALIPHIFFDRDSATIPERYNQFEQLSKTKDFRVDSLTDVTPLSLHYELLSILGERLKNRPEVTLQITGTRSQREPEPVALQRAESVSNYFQRIWNLDPRRVRAVAGVPTFPSNEATSDGRAENRRAEFSFDGESLLRPVVVEKIARVASPPAVKFYPSVVADATISRWSIRVFQGEKLIRTFGEKSNLDLPDSSRFWPLTDLRLNKDFSPFRYQLEVVDDLGQVAKATGEFTLRERVSRSPESDDRQIRENLLVGFEYNSAELQPEHRAELYEIAVSAEPGSWIEITGFTDRVGDATRNRTLSLQRANNVAEALQEFRKDLSLDPLEIPIVRGAEQVNVDRFDNNLPEGRIFSRMVSVTLNRQSDD